MDVNKIKFHCSSLGHLMAKADLLTDKQFETLISYRENPTLTKNQKQILEDLEYKLSNPSLPETLITHLCDVYVSHKYERHTEIYAKQIEKGNAVEKDSINLHGIYKGGLLLEKYEGEPLEDDFIIGTPDVLLPGHEFKSPYDLYTFTRNRAKKINPLYWWQCQGYMRLTGQKEWPLVYCLVNAPEELIAGEKARARYRCKTIDASIDLRYIAECIEIEKNMIFDRAAFEAYNPGYEFACQDWTYDVPIEERVHEVIIKRDQEAIDKIPVRVKEGRKWIAKNLLSETELINHKLL